MSEGDMFDERRPHLFVWGKEEDEPGCLNVALGGGADTPHLVATSRALMLLGDHAALEEGMGKGLEVGGLDLAPGCLIIVGGYGADGTFGVAPHVGRTPTQLELWAAGVMLDMMARNEIAKRIQGHEVKKARTDALLQSMRGMKS